jgi:hypothetical protein
MVNSMPLVETTKYIYVDLNEVCSFLVRSRRSAKRGQYHRDIPLAVFTAFLLEGYLNFAGEEMGLTWTRQDDHKNKLRKLCGKLGLGAPKALTQYSAFNRVFAVRHKIAHSSTVNLSRPVRSTRPKKKLYFLNTDWQRDLEDGKALEWLKEARDLITLLHSKIKPGRIPFGIAAEATW